VSERQQSGLPESSQASGLSAAERAELAYFLLTSLEPDEEGVAEAWRAEIARRVARIRSGQAAGRPIEEVLAELRGPSPPSLTDLPAFLKEKRREMREMPVHPWKYLVHRQHPWRQQLSITGCKMTARQLVGGIKANQLDEEKAAANYELPLEAIREALAYVEANKELLEAEAEIERLMLKRGGVARGPQIVSG